MAWAIPDSEYGTWFKSSVGSYTYAYVCVCVYVYVCMCAYVAINYLKSAYIAAVLFVLCG